MEVTEEEFHERNTTSRTENVAISSSCIENHQSNGLSDSLVVHVDGEADEKEISNKTPLLLVTSPDNDFSEKLAQLPSYTSYQRGLSVEPNVSKFDGDNENHLVPLLELPGPPDGGWGWVVCFASFMCNFIIDGIVYSFGVILPWLVDEFQSTNSTVSWAGSLVPGLYMGAGPIVGGLVNKFGCRPVCMAGGLIAGISLVLSTFVPNVPLFMLTYGFMVGFGFAMVYLPSVVSVGYYFEKKRALATGIAVCGSGVGCFAFAPLSNYLLENLNWRWTNRIFGGFAIICSLMGALMRPLHLVSKPLNSRRESNDSNGSIGNYNSLHNGPAISPVKVGFFNADEILEEEDEYDQSSQSRKSSQKTEEEQATNENNKDIQIDTAQDSSNNKTKEASKEETSRINLISRGFSNPFNAIRSRHISIQESATTPSNVNSTLAEGNTRNTFMRTMLRQNSLSERAQNASATTELSRSSIRKNMSTPHNIGRLTRMNSNTTCEMAAQKRDSTANLVYGITDGTELFLEPRSAIEQLRRPSHAPVLRPLARKDIFYSGSIMNIALPPALPEHPPPVKFEDEEDDDNMTEMQGNNLSRYRYSIISIPRHRKVSEIHRGSIVTTHLDISPAVIGKKDGLLDEKLEITRPLISVLKEMMDFASYMCNPIFLMVAISNILGFLAVYIPYVYLPDMMKIKLLDEEESVRATKASFVISLIGVSNTLGRIVLGAFVDCVPWKNTALVVTNICLVCSGISVLSFTFCVDYAAFIVCALLLGLFVSGYISLTSIVLVDLLGIDSLTSTFGLLVLFRGIASILGPPLGGLVYELTNQEGQQDYTATFYMAGSFFIVAGIISEIAHVIYFFKDKRKQKIQLTKI